MHHPVLRPAIVLAAAALTFTGCASTAGAPDARRPVATDNGTFSGDLTVYAAASLQAVFDDMGRAFTAAHPEVRFRPVYDGSSTLATQLLEGAPGDVFASADERNMSRLEERALDPMLFASNTLVIAVPAGNTGGVEELADLGDVTTVLCAPEVPCGAASATLLSRAGITVEPASLEQNVSAVLTKVATSEADAGLVYATDVIGRADLQAIAPEGADKVVNHYPVAALDDAPNADAAEAFVAFVLSDAGLGILAEHGFGAP
ncbi:molybdate ABC transporter substrate-binding protein [Microbacterium sp. NPDC058345]|uniref:molybdate ABC transporter substrate-binding protein n=1 Tax=Microbacterium sp. NPDC058345 TaxID=3346455 RepID=UPI00364FAF74